MRIVIFSHSSSVENIGGAEHALLDLIDRWLLQNHNLEIMVISRGPVGKLQPQLDKRGIAWENLNFEPWIHGIPQSQPLSLFRMFEGNSSAVLKIIEILHNLKPDLVFTNTTVVPWAALAAWELQIPHVWWLHEYIPPERFELGINHSYQDISRLSLVVLTSSQSIADYISQWVVPEKLVVCYPLPRLETIQQRIQDSLVSNQILKMETKPQLTAVLVGQFSEAKGQWLVLEAIKRLKSEQILINLTLIGFVSAHDRLNLSNYLDKHGLSGQVRITGEIEEPFDLITQSDLGIVASPVEGFGRAATEFMSAGVAVIGTNTGATSELIIDGVTGTLFTPGSVEELTAALKKYIQVPELVQRHGNAAKTHAKNTIFATNTSEVALHEILKRFREGQIRSEERPHLVDALDYVAEHLNEYVESMTHEFVGLDNSQYRFGKWIFDPLSGIRDVFSTKKRAISNTSEEQLVGLQRQENLLKSAPTYEAIARSQESHLKTSHSSIVPNLLRLSQEDEIILEARRVNDAILTSREYKAGRLVFGPFRKVRRAFKHWSR